VLYVATVGAVRGNPAIKAFCARLRDNRKPGKLAIAAGLRKLATIFNARVRDHLAAAAAQLPKDGCSAKVSAASCRRWPPDATA
jgi:transposase